jgi:hypothetical protein
MLAAVVAAGAVALIDTVVEAVVVLLATALALRTTPTMTTCLSLLARASKQVTCHRCVLLR